MRINERIADKNAVFIVLKHYFPLQNNASNTVDGCRNLDTIKLTDILMTVGTVVITLVFVQTKVEFCTMLNNCNIQRRQ